MESKPLAVGTVLKERYRITRLIAGGGMAWVYEVEELRATRPATDMGHERAARRRR